MLSFILCSFKGPVTHALILKVHSCFIYILGWQFYIYTFFLRETVITIATRAPILASSLEHSELEQWSAESDILHVDVAQVKRSSLIRVLVVEFYTGDSHIEYERTRLIH